MSSYTKPIGEITDDSEAVTIYNHPKISPGRLRAILLAWERIKAALPMCTGCREKVYERRYAVCLDCRIKEQAQ